jgi:hypothetical protein
VARSKALAEWVMRWSQRGLRSLFGARSPIVEKAGFKIPTYGVTWLLPVTFVVVFALSFLLTARASYDSENYRYLLSAELQSVAAIFAIVLTGTFVAAQVVVSATPIMMSYLPMRAFMAAVVFNVVTMAVDAVALAQLPEAATGIAEFAMNLAVVLPGEALLFTFGYVGTALLWTRPDIHLAAVLNRMDQADDLSSQQKAVVAIEQLGRYGSERGHIQTCRDAVRAFEVAADLVLAKSNLDTEAVGQDISHPLRTIPEALGRLGAAYAERGLDDAVHPIAWSLGGLGTKYCARDEGLVDVWLTMPLAEVAESCGRHSREWALYNFLGNKNRCLSWFAETRAHEILRMWALSIEDEAEICARYKLPNAADEVVKQLDTLVALAERGQLRDHFCDCAGVRRSLDWVAEITALIDKAQGDFGDASISDRTPKFGDRALCQSLADLRSRIEALGSADDESSPA